MKIIECPRDAMQGIEPFIPTEKKVQYINVLLRVGFDTIDAGSFVSPKSIPQMADTADVLSRIDLLGSATRLLVIVANVRGAEQAATFRQIHYLGFPLSLSETFQRRNTNKSIADAFDTVRAIQKIAAQTGQQPVVYLSMGFGNPYGDPYDSATVVEFVNRLAGEGIGIVSLADTMGMSAPDQIERLFTDLLLRFPAIELGAHLHAPAHSAREKIEAAIRGGCQRIDGALNGYGGCPLAEDELVGNVATEDVLSILKLRGVPYPVNEHKLREALELASEIFPKR